MEQIVRAGEGNTTRELATVELELVAGGTVADFGRDIAEHVVAYIGCLKMTQNGKPVQCVIDGF